MCHSYLTADKSSMCPHLRSSLGGNKKKNLKSGKNETGNRKELNKTFVQSQSQMNKTLSEQIKFKKSI